MSRLSLLLCFLAAPCFGDDSQWQTLNLLKQGDLSVHLRVRQSASLADEKWIAFEFRNRAETPLPVESVSYRIESQGFDDASGKALYQGSLGQGNIFDLFGKTRTVMLPTGATESWRHVSDYATALISDREQPVRIDAKVHFSIRLKDGRLLKTRSRGEDHVKVSVVWRKWKTGDLPQIQERLLRLLRQPQSHHSVGYVIGRLLKTPEIAEKFTAEDLVAALPLHMKDAFSGRDPILRHLNEYFADDDAVADFIFRQIVDAGKPVPAGVQPASVTNSFDVQTLLRHFPGVWRDDYLDGLLALYKNNGAIRYSVLRHLSRHGLPRADDQALSRQLSSVFFADGQVARLREGRLQDTRQFITMMGMTRDRRLVAALAPLLRDRRELPASGLPIPPQRICDVARRAIQTILDGKAAAVSEPLAKPFANTKAPRPQADEAIAKLEERLKSTPEFAAAVRPRMDMAKADREIAERWKANRQTVDFLTVKKIVKPGMSVEQVRDVLGRPLRIEQSDAGTRQLYLEPDFRASLGQYHWLLVKGDKVVQWQAEPWNDRYGPEAAPPLTPAAFGDATDHGEFDDVYMVSDADVIIVRRGTTWSQLSLPDGKFTRFGDFPGLGRTKVTHALKHGERTWLLCESKDIAPFAIDLEAGKHVAFTIDGADLPATIQSHTLAPAGTALLMISGGAKEKWPRDGNRPIYHWLNLATGESRQLPTGWDPSYFVPDLSVVVGRFHGEVAVDLRTGEAQPYGQPPAIKVGFDWGDTSRARSIEQKDDMIGVSMGGKAHYFRTPFKDPYIANLQTKRKQLAFHLRGYANKQHPWSLWTADLKPRLMPSHVADGVRQWELFSPQHIAFNAQLKKLSGDAGEAFIYDISTNKIWNVLDGVEGLPGDNSNAQIVPPFGSDQRPGWVLTKASGWESPTGLRNHWRRWVAVTAENQRYLIAQIPDVANSDLSQLRLHNSGTFVMTTYRHHETETPRVRFQLRTAPLQVK